MQAITTLVSNRASVGIEGIVDLGLSDHVAGGRNERQKAFATKWAAQALCKVIKQFFLL